MSQIDACVSISVSPPGDHELLPRGLSEDHLRHAFVEVARQILASGGSLAYGGDLRAGGYTETLIALLRTYSRADRPSKERVRQYLARPVWEQMAPSDAIDPSIYLTVVKVPGGRNGVQDRASKARDFTAMREAMARDTSARVIIGGRLAGQTGRWPGIVEEAYLTIAARRPLFVCGGLGGAAGRVALALIGLWPEELTESFQQAHNDDYEKLVADDVGPSEATLRRALLEAELKNGLEPEENRLLLETADLDLMVALVLRGLCSVEPLL